MSWAKNDEAIKSNHRALLSSYGQLRSLLARGLSNPELAPHYCESLITHVKMRDSLKSGALNSKPVVIEEVLLALPPVPIILLKR